MSVKIAIILNDQNLSGKLTKFFTGCYAYHIGFLDEESNRFYDMNLLFRRRTWPYYTSSTVELYDCPIPLTKADLEHVLETDPDHYGFFDYLSFGLRRFPRLFGFKVRDHKGSICSEKVNQILVDKGWESPWQPGHLPPSPCDWRRYLTEVKTST